MDTEVTEKDISEAVTQAAAWDANWAERFPVRITGKQKTAFLNELEQELKLRGFETERHAFRSLGFTNQVLITRCSEPRAIFLAHIDTATIMPFWLAWLSRLFGHTRQVEMTIAVFLFILFFYELLPKLMPSLILDIAQVFLGAVLLISSITLLIPTPHNREDNTSGVLGLMTLADWMKDKPVLRERVQFAFVDNEELGLLGSSALKRYWDQSKHPYQNAVIVSLDCISRGKKPLLVYHKEDNLARRLLPYIQRLLPDTETTNMGFLPLSDNYTFREHASVNISLADRSILPGGYFIPDIHSPGDNDFSTERFGKLMEGIALAVRAISTLGISETHPYKPTSL
ncbi:MAG: M28 family peptidase [Chloroflexi bacterium]|nr:MAG: M28 family peptidase [Chloroflexota bacterium]